MEPAVYRREHQAVLERMDRALGHVAMEPAVYRREHTPYANQIRDPVSSQWSPPFIGGSTISLVERGKRGATVAMEPAVYRREHGMIFTLTSTARKSQWSPPFIGESTLVMRREAEARAASQWSPSFIGGSTVSGHDAPRSAGMSQWSPPFIGGSTSIAKSPTPVMSLVAMEPAVYRREHARVAGVIA